MNQLGIEGGLYLFPSLLTLMLPHDKVIFWCVGIDGNLADHQVRRDDYLVGMSACLGAAVATAVTGVLLLVIDEEETPVGFGPGVWDEGTGLVVMGRF